MALLPLILGLILLSPSLHGFLFNDKEEILLVPSVAFRNHSKAAPTDWLLYNQGWFYESDLIQSKLMELSLQKVIKKDLNVDRIRVFTAAGREHRRLCIDGLNRSMCTVTDDEGRIQNTFQMSNQEVRGLTRTDNGVSKVLYQVSEPNKNIRATGEIFLCDDNGISFISDIDDTIKITGVTSSTDTLINTFSGTFRAVSGMSDAYQYWQKRYNATFSYVTASPDQLYSPLREFFDREKFPAGSAHMRHFTWLEGNFIAFFMSSSYIKSKTETIDMFVTNTVNRTFVLLGDIFQKDPEIYASAHLKYPSRIGRIFIRKYHNDTVGQQRLDDVFKNIPRKKWSTFESGSELPKDVFA